MIRKKIALAAIGIMSIMTIGIVGGIECGTIGLVAGITTLVLCVSGLELLVGYLETLQDRERKRSGRWRRTEDADVEEYKKGESK